MPAVILSGDKKVVVADRERPEPKPAEKRQQDSRRLRSGPDGLRSRSRRQGLRARVMAVDILDVRLEQARILGADDIVNSRDSDVAEAIRNLTHGRGVEVAMDCSGNPAGQNTALDSAAKLGCVAFRGRIPGYGNQPE